MDLRDVVLNHTGLFLAGVAIWIPVAIWIVSLINQMIMGEVDVLVGIIGIFGGICLGVVGMHPSDPRMSPVYLGVALLTLVMFPIVRAANRRRQLGVYEYEIIERAYENLDLNPQNSGAKLRLAKALFNRGMPLNGIAILADMLESTNARHFPEEHRLLQEWTHRTQGQVPKPIACIRCRNSNPPQMPYCMRCGCRLYQDYAGGWLRSGYVQKIAAAWGAALLAIAAIPFAKQNLPPGATIVVIPIVILGVIYILWRAFQNDED